MIDYEYIARLFVEQREMTTAAIDRGAYEAYHENLGVDLAGLLNAAMDYAAFNASETDLAVHAGVRMFTLGVLAGRDETQDPRRVVV